MRFAPLRYTLLAAAIIFLFLAAQRQLDDVRELAGHEALYTGELAETTRLEREMLIFTQGVAEYVTQSGHTTREDMLLHFDVLWSRVNTQYSKNFISKITSMKRFTTTLHDLSLVLKDIDPTVQNLRPGDTIGLTRIMEAIRPYREPVADLTGTAYSELQQGTIDHVQLQRRAMTSLNHVQLMLMLFTMAAFTFLILQLLRGEKLMRKLQAREAEIRALASRDHLTGLSNRRQFDDWLASVEKEQSADKLHLLLVDLDGFKSINDTQGHVAGDLVLQEVATRLREIAGSKIRLARIGGDEFALLVEASHEQAATVASSVVVAMGSPMAIDGTAVKLGACVGIATTLGRQVTAKQLVIEADTALYHAKSDGGSSFAFYSEALSATVAHSGTRDTLEPKSVRTIAVLS